MNTMIIQDADNMGLFPGCIASAGVWGRSNRTAYAFLMYKRDKMLKEVAEKRLAAIKEYTELGSGFKIAMRDLEIRGGGQPARRASSTAIWKRSAMICTCKMLNEAVKEAKGHRGGGKL